MRIFLVCTLSILLLFQTATADSLKRADADDVEMLLDAASGNNSAYWASLIGSTRGRVYIQYESAVHSGSLFTEKMSHIIYWLPETELSKDQLAMFIAYKNQYESESDK